MQILSRLAGFRSQSWQAMLASSAGEGEKKSSGAMHLSKRLPIGMGSWGFDNDCIDKT
jgi:hypothetical protein